MIRVYADAGVAQAPLNTLLFELNAWRPQPITAQEIRETPWETTTSLLVIPGGRDVEYHEALQGLGNQKIAAFVENGGSFLGICAGAYYGCSYVEFDKGMPLEVLGSRELQFFQGIGKGPAYGPGTYYYDSEKGARAAPITDPFSPNLETAISRFDSCRVYFNGGCCFPEAENFPEVTILSRYLDLPGNPAAIIECARGMGKAILSGVHFEIGLRDPHTTLNRKYRKLLQEYEKQRVRFLEAIIARLTLK